MKIIKRIIKLIVILIIIALILAFIINKVKKNKDSDNENSETISYESEVIKQDIINTLSASGYIETALEENKSLHATYYLKKVYFVKNQIIKKGTKLIKYTNGKYLKAPYDCIVTDSSLPSVGNVCTNSHYITLQSVDSLLISMSVSENELDTISLGQEARITIDSLDNKEYVGYVTNIGNSGTYSSSESTFPVTVEFENDGNVLIGMSAKSAIVLEKAEEAITVANDAINEENGNKYVTVKKSDGTTENVTIETGITNGAYTEVKSGLSEGDIVIITEQTNNSNNRNMRMNGGDMNSRGGGQFKNRSGSNSNGESNRPSGGNMPSGGFNKN